MIAKQPGGRYAPDGIGYRRLRLYSAASLRKKEKSASSVLSQLAAVRCQGR